MFAPAWLWIAFQTAEAYLDNGVGLLQKGRFADAAAELTRAIEKNPKLAEAHYLMGLIRQERGDRELALTSFRAALQIQPRHAGAQARLAEVMTYIARARESGYAEAAAACRRALVLNPSDADSLFHLGWIEAAMGEHGNAVTHYRAALRLQPKYPGARIGLAISQLELHQEDAALPGLQQLVKDEPENPDAYVQLGVALSRKDRCAEAVPVLERAITLRPGVAQAHYLLGMCYRKLGQGDAAGKSLAQYREQQAAANTRQQARFQAAAAHKHLQAGHLEEAIAAYRSSLELHPDDTVATDLSVALLKKGQPAEVLPLLESRVSGSPLAGYTLALAHRELKNQEAAVHLLVSVLQAKPDFAEAHHLLGVIWISMGREAEGARHLQIAARLRPDNPAFRTR
ncbi:MAG: tetratricopeptide repeat protein [Bryobacteraceae bacterium]